jgi:hypothetical protein
VSSNAKTIRAVAGRQSTLEGPEEEYRKFLCKKMLFFRN